MAKNNNVEINLKAFNFISNNKYLLFVGFFIFIIFQMTYFTISSGTVGVKSTFGSYQEDVLNPGLHFKIPFIQSVQILDIKKQTVTYKGGSSSTSNGVYNRPGITVLDEKNLTIQFDVNIQYTPKKEEMVLILSTIGTNYFNKELDSIFRKVIRDVTGKYNAENVSTKREEISAEISAKMNNEFERRPFIINNINIRNITLPKIIQNKAISIQEANQEEERLKIMEKQATQQQKIVEVEAQTNFNKMKIDAEAQQQKKQIEADAEAYSITTVADAKAKANILISKSITTNLVKYNTIENWDGKLPSTSLQGGNGVNPNIILGNK